MPNGDDTDDLPIIEAYHQITRRKAAHAVHLPDRPEAYVSMRLTDCLWWLDREGWSEYRLHSDHGWFRCRIAKEL